MIRSAFWREVRSWPLGIQVILFLGLVFLAIAIVTSSVWFYAGLENMLQWDVVSELRDFIFENEALTIGGYTFNVPEQVYYVVERFQVSLKSQRLLPSYLLFYGCWAGLFFILAGASNLRKGFFLFSIVTLALYGVTARWEQVFLTTSNGAFLVYFVLFAGTIYYLSHFKTMWPIRKRMKVLGLIFGLGLVLFFVGNQVSYPTLSYASFGVLFALVVSIVFVFFVGHELYMGLIYVVGSAAIKGKSSFNAYLLAGFILILNLVLVYLENARYIEPSPFIINPFFLLVICSLLGLGGFYKYNEDTGWLSFQQSAVWLYLGMAIITFCGIGYALGMGNDALIGFYEDMIAVMVLVVTICFFAHGVANYSQLLRQGYNIHTIFWKPKISRLLLARVGAVLLLGFAFSQKNFYILDQVRAGLAISQADYFMSNGEDRAAESFLKEATTFDTYNHRANLGLAILSQKAGDRVNAAYYFNQANFKDPSAQAYVGLSNQLQSEGLFFDAIFKLKEGLQEIPHNPYLATNLAYFMEKAKQQDSTYLYQVEALDNCYNCKVATTNHLAFWLKEGKPDSIQQRVEPLDSYQDFSYLANKAAIKRLTKDSLQNTESIELQPLSVAQFAYMFNKELVQPTLPDSVLLQLQQLNANAFYANHIDYLRLASEYKKGDKLEAIKRLTKWVEESKGLEKQIKSKQLAIWYLNEGLLPKAVEYFTIAQDSVTASLLLTDAEFVSNMKNRAEVRAMNLNQNGLDITRYEQILNKAPLNLKHIEWVTGELEKKGKYLEAYVVWNELTDFMPSEPLVWKKCAELAIRNGVPQYAADALAKLNEILPTTDYLVFKKEMNRLQENFNSSFQ